MFALGAVLALAVRPGDRVGVLRLFSHPFAGFCGLAGAQTREGVQALSRGMMRTGTPKQPPSMQPMRAGSLGTSR